MIPDGISFDPDNPKYRQFTRGNDILEYTLEGDQIAVDWLSGKNAASMLKAILDIEGTGVIKISGYVTDKLGKVTDSVLQRFGDQIAGRLGGRWRATIHKIEGRRYLELRK